MRQVPVSLIPIPKPTPWKSPGDIEKYAVACLQSVGLIEWSFAFDRAIRRLGCCKPAKFTITLSKHFVHKFLAENPELIRRTILHEVAHALAWQHKRISGHGSIWHQYCVLLGIPNERARCQCPDFAPESLRNRPDRYILCHCETGEIFHRYKNRPRISPLRLKHCYITGRKSDTLGYLSIVQLKDS